MCLFFSLKKKKKPPVCSLWSERPNPYCRSFLYFPIHFFSKAYMLVVALPRSGPMCLSVLITLLHVLSILTLLSFSRASKSNFCFFENFLNLPTSTPTELTAHFTELYCTSAVSYHRIQSLSCN